MHPLLSRITALPLLLAPAGAADPGAPPPARVAFGSCCRQDLPQPVWEAVRSVRPELFLFLGDNIYGDTADLSVLRAKYARLDAAPGFRALREHCEILGVWDDHDYGANDAGADYAMRDESQRAFADFFRLPEDSPVRHRPGIYDARVYGPEGRRLQILLLDVRYFRSPLVDATDRGPRGPYGTNLDPGATILGEAQWEWLAQRLREPADLRLILSGTQFLPEDHGWECWNNFPRERARLLRLIGETGAGGVILLSGDRHLAEIMSLSPEDPLSPGVAVHEITSSSLNLPGGGKADEPNRHRVSPGNYRRENFGLLEIDWAKREVRAGIRDLQGAEVFSRRISFAAP